MSNIKSTSFEYGQNYQLNQAEKYRNRIHNHWKFRVELAKNLVEKYALPLFENNHEKLTVVDIGCSIGTFAIEFAKSGYHSYGIDFDNSALEIARSLAEEENVSPEFICGDVSDWKANFPAIDIAICFDIFEHLHDDELGSLLSSLKKQLSTQGSLVFHTFPTQYDYLFFEGFRYFPLALFAHIVPANLFNRIVKIYSLLVDIILIFAKGMTYQERIKNNSHCNPTTVQRITEILERAGYKIVYMKSSNLYNFKNGIQKWFSRQPISYRNIYGVAIPKS
jgi:2-polyprenyl-3-methyl-5-hydroxy-6-metoxy-1,4-benzoquinol methylase